MPPRSPYAVWEENPAAPPRAWSTFASTSGCSRARRPMKRAPARDPIQTHLKPPKTAGDMGQISVRILDPFGACSGSAPLGGGRWSRPRRRGFEHASVRRCHGRIGARKDGRHGSGFDTVASMGRLTAPELLAAGVGVERVRRAQGLEAPHVAKELSLGQGVGRLRRVPRSVIGLRGAAARLFPPLIMTDGRDRRPGGRHRRRRCRLPSRSS
jgi:hypothetical protein